MSTKIGKHIIIKHLTRAFILLLVLFLGLVLFIRSSWGQDLIINKIINYVSDKTGTEIAISKLFVTFSGDIQLEGLYLEDKKGDTLLFSNLLEADIAFTPLLFENTLELDNLDWRGVTARIIRHEEDTNFNFTFLQEALVTKDSGAEPEIAEPFKLAIGNITLKDFNVLYNDAFLGIDSKIKCDDLFLEVDEIDLEAMHFLVDNLEIYNSQLHYKQTKVLPTNENDATTQLPYISMDKFRIENVEANYGSTPDKLQVNTFLKEFSLNTFKADIVNATYEFEDFRLNNSNISLKIDEVKRAQDSIADQGTSDMVWPALSIAASEIEMENNTLHYGRENTKTTKGVFNPNDISLKNFHFKAHDLKYEPKLANLNVEALSFLEKSGFLLQNMTFESSLGDTTSKLENFSFLTANSSITGAVTMNYTSIDQVFNDQREVQLEVNVPKIKFGLEDAFYFQPTLASSVYFGQAKQHAFEGQLFAKGTLDKIKLDNARLQWGDLSSVALAGTMANPTNLESLSFDLGKLNGITSRSDLLLFVSEEDLSIAIPKELNLKATAKGTLQDFVAQATVKVPEGMAQLNGNIKFQNSFDFKGTLAIDSLKLDKLLKNEEFGGLSLTADGSVSATSLSTLNADFITNISRFQYNGYDYENIAANGKVDNGKGTLTVDYKDKNLDFSTAIAMQLDTTNYDVQVELDLKGADLQALKITTNGIKVRAGANVLFKGTPEDFELRSTLSDGLAVLDNIQYMTDDIKLVAHLDSTATHLDISSGFLNGNLDANSSPEKITSALKQQLRSYFSEGREPQAETDSVRVEINAKLTPEPILTEVFLKGLQQLDTVTLNAKFDGISKNLNAALNAPSAQYGTSILDSLKISLNGDANDLNFYAEVGGMKYSPVQIKKSFFQGRLKNRELFLDFRSLYENEESVHLSAEMSLQKDTVLLHINPMELTFNKKKWSIPDDNKISFAKDYLFFENMVLTRENEKMELTGTVPEIQKDHLGLLFKNFRLQNLLSFFNPDEALASGVLQGSLILENPYGATGLVTDLSIDEFALLGNPIGQLTIDATSSSFSKYTIGMALKDGGIDLELNGNYTATEQGANFDIDVDLQRLETQFIQGFFPEKIAQAKGYLSGNLKLGGTSNDPLYEGQISFHETALEVVPLNVTFKIDTETLSFDETKILVDQFDIQDGNGNLLALDGTIGTKTLSNPSFDLSFETENFNLVNSTEEDNELFYGIVSADADMQISGNLALPKVQGKTRIRKGTELNYVVPERQLDIQERDGVVIFVNRENPGDILTGNEKEETPITIRGVDIDMALEIAEEVVFNIILDKRTDDRLQVQGEANLNLNLDPNGAIGLIGNYKLSSGFYQTNLYNLVSRKFDIKSGSTITWLGDPLDAKLDVTAIYEVKTSPAPLMAGTTSGVDTGLAPVYQDKTPFLVYLNIKGNVLQPSLSFDLDIPEDSKGELDAGVYGKIQQLNEQESELNKQVFSLLAFNVFFPSTGSDGSSGGAQTIARNNLNQVLSSGLNSFSEKVFGNSGFELDFDLDSFTDYRGDTAQDRTQLSINAKNRFFNDRLIVTVGSAVDVDGSAQVAQQETPVIGNVSLEYLLTKNGKYRLKGYQRNEYANIIDGNLIVSGIAFIFNREFNAFSELFSPIKSKEENDKKNDLKKDKEKTAIE